MILVRPGIQGIVRDAFHPRSSSLSSTCWGLPAKIPLKTWAVIELIKGGWGRAQLLGLLGLFTRGARGGLVLRRLRPGESTVSDGQLAEISRLSLQLPAETF